MNTQFKTILVASLLLGLPMVRSYGQTTETVPMLDIHTVIEQYQALVGKTVIYDNTVAGPLSVPSTAGMVNDKAISMIEDALFASDYSLVDLRDGSIELLGLARNARGVGVPSYDQIEALPRGERVVTFIFKLKQRDAEEVRSVIAKQIVQKLYTNVIADQKSRTVAVTDRTSVIRNLVPLVAALDK